MVDHRVAHLRSHGVHRVERVHRALRDVADRAQAVLAHGRRRQRQQVGAVDDGGCRRSQRPGGRSMLHQRQRRGRLAGAGFADQPEPLAWRRRRS